MGFLDKIWKKKPNRVYLSNGIENDNSFYFNYYQESFNKNKVNIEYINRMTDYIDLYYSYDDNIIDIINKDCILLEIGLFLPPSINLSESPYKTFYKIKRDIQYMSSYNKGLLWTELEKLESNSKHINTNILNVLIVMQETKENIDSMLNIYIELICMKRIAKYNDKLKDIMYIKNAIANIHHIKKLESVIIPNQKNKCEQIPKDYKKDFQTCDVNLENYQKELEKCKEKQIEEIKEIEELIYERFEKILNSLNLILSNTLKLPKNILGDLRSTVTKDELENINLGELNVGCIQLNIKDSNNFDSIKENQKENITIDMENYEHKTLDKLVEDLHELLFIVIVK